MESTATRETWDRELARRLDGGRLHLARDARAAEALLLARVRAFHAAVRKDPRELRRRLLVLVPSRALRTHLVAALVRDVGSALAGVDVRTIAAFAQDLAARAGEAVPLGERLIGLLAKRAAARRPALERALGKLEDGHACLEGAVVDLVDAGAVPATAAALDDWLAAGEVAKFALRAEIQRARAIVGTMAEVELERERLAATGRAGLWRRAAEIVRSRGDELLGEAEVWLVGFSDATGLLADALEAIARRPSTQIVLCAPADPWEDARRPASDFPDRLLARLASVARLSTDDAMAAARSDLSLVTARGHEAEVRHALDGIRAARREGVREDRMAIVARDLAPYVVPLRIASQRLGVPLFAPGARGPRSPAGRRIAAFVDLVRDGARTATTRVIEALDESTLVGARTAGRHAAIGELVLGCHALGAGRVASLAELDVERVLGDRAHFLLPLRTRASGGGTPVERDVADLDDESDEPPVEAATFEPGTRRRLPRARLERAVELARAIVGALTAWESQPCDARAHASRTIALAHDVLGWRDAASTGTDGAPPRELDVLRERANAVAADLGHATRLTADEWAQTLADDLESALREPLGSGGGVRVLGVMEARGMAFDRVWVLGLARDRFPQRVSEDPLLPDALRARMAELLPDMPVRARRHAEERHLFAELVASADRVVVVAPVEDDDGRELAPSPFFTRLAWPFGPHEVGVAAGLLERVAQGGEASSFERAVLHGTSSRAQDRRRAAPAWRAAAEASWLEAVGAPVTRPQERRRAERWRDAREAVLAAFADLRRDGAPLGPFDGRIGRITGDDPRTAPLYVTTLERFAECGWRTMLEKLLRLAPTPDPLAALPALEKRLVGSLVHHVLERIVRPVGDAERLEDVRARAPMTIPWPADDVLDRLLQEGAAALAADEGLSLPGLVRALIARARKTLLLARELEFGSGALHAVVGAELSATIVLDPWLGERRELHLRTDRVDRADDGALRLVDYKTGKPKVRAVQVKARDEARVRQIARGALLQGVAYSIAGGGEGVYVHLEEEDAARARLACDVSDPRQSAAFALAMRTLDAAWRVGAFPPRLVDEKEREPTACEHCELATACLRGDSGARARLLAAGRGPDLPGADAAWLDLWRLPERARVFAKEGSGG